MDQPKPVSDASVGPRLTYLIKRLEMIERSRLEESLRSVGVSLHQYTTLSLLERRDGLSSAQLARRHFVTPQAMNQLVATLEAEGLICRQPDPANRRILRVTLTARGREVLLECHTVVDVLEQHMLEAMSESEATSFRNLVERIIDALTVPG